MALEQGTERATDAAISSMDAAAKANLTAGAGDLVDRSRPNAGPSDNVGVGRTQWGPGRSFDDREPSYCTPSGSALAATWDAAMVLRVGELVGRDARRKDLDVVLGPTVNLHRSPLGGRGFECHSEDPLLTTEIAVAWVAGVQSQGVAATVKHLSQMNRRTHA